MIFGATGLSVYSFIRVGGYSGLVEKYMTALPENAVGINQGNSTCGWPSPKAFTMLREPSDKDYPWPGFLLGQSPASIWYWAADQVSEKNHTNRRILKELFLCINIGQNL